MVGAGQQAVDSDLSQHITTTDADTGARAPFASHDSIVARRADGKLVADGGFALHGSERLWAKEGMDECAVRCAPALHDCSERAEKGAARSCFPGNDSAGDIHTSTQVPLARHSSAAAAAAAAAAAGVNMGAEIKEAVTATRWGPGSTGRPQCAVPPARAAVDTERLQCAAYIPSDAHECEDAVASAGAATETEGEPYSNGCTVSHATAAADRERQQCTACGGQCGPSSGARQCNDTKLHATPLHPLGAPQHRQRNDSEPHATPQHPAGALQHRQRDDYVVASAGAAAETEGAPHSAAGPAVDGGAAYDIVFMDLQMPGMDG